MLPPVTARARRVHRYRCTGHKKKKKKDENAQARSHRNIFHPPSAQWSPSSGVSRALPSPRTRKTKNTSISCVSLRHHTSVPGQRLPSSANKEAGTRKTKMKRFAQEKPCRSSGRRAGAKAVGPPVMSTPRRPSKDKRNKTSSRKKSAYSERIDNNSKIIFHYPHHYTTT